MSWTVEETNDTVSTIRIPFRKRRDWEQWVLLSSDRHIDNPKSDSKLAKRHLDQAKERNAPVIDCGDLFCAMQTRNDKRGSKSDLKEKHKKSAYLNELVKDAADFFSPYKDILAIIGTGNHETAIKKNNEYDLTTGLVEKLQDRGSGVILGGYRGWVKFAFRQANGAQSQTVNMYYTHAGGGGGEVTKGVIKTNRRAVYLPDAHIVIGGHIHEAWQVEIVRARLSDAGKEYADEQLHVCLPTYKEEFIGTNGGFHHEKERAPKPLGAQWLRFFFDPSQERIRYECHRAK